jgi:hypothetical protein
MAAKARHPDAEPDGHKNNIHAGLVREALPAMNKAAQQLGRLGGKATSEAKRAAARENWKKAAAALRKKRKAANNSGSRSTPQPKVNT